MGIFKGSSLVVVAGFGLMIPVAYIFCVVWPQVQAAIASLQVFLTSAGVFGVWLYTFLERFLIPTGLHHFIYLPFIFGPAVVDNGLQAYWLEHIRQFAESTKPLIELYPQGGFSLHGMSKLFGCPGIALAMYYTAKPARRKKIAALVAPAAVVAVFCGITEPLEFTFLFVAPALFAVHAILAATLSSTMYFFGVTGNETNWLAAANCAGSEGGKLLSPQSIAIATAACDMEGQDGDIMRKTMPFAIFWILMNGLMVFLGLHVI